MAKRNNKLKRNEERDTFDEGIYDSFREIIPVKTSRAFDITDLFRNVAQRLAYSVYEQHDILFLLGPAGTGKALTLDSKLYTRDGPIRMGDVKIGDEVADHTGNFSRVVGVYPQGKKLIYRVHFSDFTHVDCCAEHLWEVKHSGNGWTRVVDTKFLKDNCRREDGKRVLSVVCSKPVNFNRKYYVIDPYFMGIILTEGNLTNSNLVFSSKEEEIVHKVSSLLTDGYICKSRTKDYGIDHRVVKTCKSSKSNLYKDELKRLGLWGKYSWEKSIPQDYLYGSVDQRISLLQGMMDGDGTVEKTGSMSYSTTSHKMAEDFCQLVYSLGGTTRVKIKEGAVREDGSRHRVSYRCYLNLPNNIEVFLLNRKKRLCKSRVKYLPKRYVDRVEVLSEAEMQCIMVDNDRHLYLTDNFTVTHNSHLACMFAINDLLRESKSRIVLTRPIVEAGESLGYLPGTFSEKTDPYMLPLYDCIRKMIPTGGALANEVQQNTEVAPLAYMRGRSTPLDSKVLTPKGYRKMGDIKVGDYVCGSDGQPTRVLGVYPQGKLDTYRLHFSDGVSVECSGDHLWSTMTLNEKRHGKGYSVKTTHQIKETLKDGFNRKVHRIPLTEPVYFDNDEVLPVDPYVLGVILGDGNFHRKASVTITNVGQDVVSEVSRLLPAGVRLVLAKNCKVPQYRLSVKKGEKNPIRRFLEKEELLGLKSHQKFIPKKYLYAPLCFRMELLKGLMDTDGSVFEHRSGNSRVQYYSTSLELAKGVRFLVHSIGGTASIRKREFGEDDVHEHRGKMVRHCRPVYVVDIVVSCNPFKMHRKADRFKAMKPQRLICKIDYVGKKDCQCIKVAAANSLYLMEHCIVTHNTFDNSVCILDEAQNCSWGQLLLFLTRLGENSKMIITGDPNQSDIGRDSALMDVYHRLEGVTGIGMVKFTEEHIVRHKLVSEIIKRLQKSS